MRDTPSRSRRSSHRKKRDWKSFGFFVAGLFIVLMVGIVLLNKPNPTTSQANPTDAEQVAKGKERYQALCAQCHGINLEGQPNWREPLPNGMLPAPPHDMTGHTWHHPDTMLFDIIQKGSMNMPPDGQPGGMPGFGTVLTDDEIWAVIAYIKSTWSPAIQQRPSMPPQAP